MAKANSYHWEIRPRYTPGSPTVFFYRDRDLALQVAQEEKRAYEDALTGIYGEGMKQQAERLGLRGIVVRHLERRRHWECYDEATGESYDLPFMDEMAKRGYRRWSQIPAPLQTLIRKVEPIVAIFATQDSRSFWFREPPISEFWNPDKGGYDDPRKPEGLVWEPVIKARS